MNIQGQIPGRGAYAGPERRRHRVFVTKNSEYHTRDGICIAVRDRTTGRFCEDHMALGKRVSSGIRFNDEGGIASISQPGNAHIGEQLCFTAGDHDLEHEIITSPLTAILRPPKEILRVYPN